MAFPWDLLITGTMTTAAALGGTLVANHLNRGSEREVWSRDDRLMTVRGVLDAQSETYYSMLRASTVDEARKLDQRRWKEALHRLQVTGDPDLVEAGNRLDMAIWELSLEQRSRGWLGEDWAPLAEMIDERLLEFTNTARRSLGIPESLTRGHGRPTATERLQRDPQRTIRPASNGPDDASQTSEG